MGQAPGAVGQVALMRRASCSTRSMLELTSEATAFCVDYCNCKHDSIRPHVSIRSQTTSPQVSSASVLPVVSASHQRLQAPIPLGKSGAIQSPRPEHSGSQAGSSLSSPHLLTFGLPCTSYMFFYDVLTQLQQHLANSLASSIWINENHLSFEERTQPR